jgi:hypothetical protein
VSDEIGVQTQTQERFIGGFSLIVASMSPPSVFSWAKATNRAQK